jgi:hypothetical protein
MLRRLAAGMSVGVLLALLASALTTGATRASSQVCTGWTSETAPPPALRVLRTWGPASGVVQVVPFRAYVEDVLSLEFGWNVPRAALHAGAIAVKQYAWYYAAHWRGRSAGGQCYDVVDNTSDQLYRPERAQPRQQHLAAVAATWPISIRKAGRFFATGYRDGSDVECGVNADGWRLYQHSAYRCASDGLTAESILRRYYEPGLEIVDPGSGDISGDQLGDVAVLMPSPGLALAGIRSLFEGWGWRIDGSVLSGTLVARIYESAAVPAATPAPSPELPPWAATPAPFAAATPGPSGATPSPLPDTPIPPITLPIDPASVVDESLADVTGDHLADLVVLQRDEQGILFISVAVAASGAGFMPPLTWWTSADSEFHLPDGAYLRLVTGDFDGGGTDDVGLVAGIEGPPPAPDGTPTDVLVPGSARFYVLRSTGAGLDAPETSWGPATLNLASVTALGADVTGDGKADLVLQGRFAPDAIGQARPGMRVLVAESGIGDGLGKPFPWYETADVSTTASQTVAADLDRDGRTDLVVGQPYGVSGTRFLGLMSSGGAFSVQTLWSAATGYAWGSVKMASADVNGDGRGDVVVLYNMGRSGTRLHVFLSTGTALRPTSRMTDPTLVWNSARPL